MSVAGFSLFRTEVLLVTLSHVLHFELSNQLVQNEFLRKWKQMTQLLKLQCCLQLPRFFYISKIGTGVFSQCTHAALFLDKFPEPEHSPLLLLADWHRFNLFCDFDTSRSDLYVNIDGT